MARGSPASSRPPTTASTAVDGGLAKTQDFLASLGSDKYGGDLLPTVISLRELIESFDKKSGAVIADTRRMLDDLSQSINKQQVRQQAPRPTLT